MVAVLEDGETISPTFARSPYFKVVEDGETVRVVENPYMDAVPAGPPAAELVAGFNPEVVVAGAFGGNALSVLRSKGIRTSSSLPSLGSSGSVDVGRLGGALIGATAGFVAFGPWGAVLGALGGYWISKKRA